MVGDVRISNRACKRVPIGRLSCTYAVTAIYYLSLWTGRELCFLHEHPIIYFTVPN